MSGCAVLTLGSLNAGWTPIRHHYCPFYRFRHSRPPFWSRRRHRSPFAGSAAAAVVAAGGGLSRCRNSSTCRWVHRAPYERHGTTSGRWRHPVRRRRTPTWSGSLKSLRRRRQRRQRGGLTAGRRRTSADAGGCCRTAGAVMSPTTTTEAVRKWRHGCCRWRH